MRIQSRTCIMMMSSFFCYEKTASLFFEPRFGLRLPKKKPVRPSLQAPPNNERFVCRLPRRLRGYDSSVGSFGSREATSRRHLGCIIIAARGERHDHDDGAVGGDAALRLLRLLNESAVGGGRSWRLSWLLHDGAVVTGRGEIEVRPSEEEPPPKKKPIRRNSSEEGEVIPNHQTTKPPKHQHQTTKPPTHQPNKKHQQPPNHQTTKTQKNSQNKKKITNNGSAYGVPFRFSGRPRACQSRFTTNRSAGGTTRRGSRAPTGSTCCAASCSSLFPSSSRIPACRRSGSARRRTASSRR